MQRLEVDDTSSLIGYFGEWTALRGSSRQWQSTIHSTAVKTASAAINFQGTRVVIYCTIPIGSGTDVLATVTLDGHPTTFSHLTNSSAIYASVLFDSGPIPDIRHSIVLTNSGSAATSPLQLDRFHLEGTVFNVSPGNVGPTSTGGTTSTSRPSVGSSTGSGSGFSTPTTGPSTHSLSPPTSASSNNAAVLTTLTDSNGDSKIVSLPQDFKGSGSIGSVGLLQTTITGTSPKLLSSYLVTTTNADGTVVTEVVDSPRIQSTSGSAHIPRGAIIGCVIGVITFITLVVVFLLRRHKNHRSRNGHILLPDERTPEPTRVDPFDLTNRSTEHGTDPGSRRMIDDYGVEYPRNEKSKSVRTSSTDPDANVSPTASSRSLIQPSKFQNPRLPRLTLEHGCERPAYVIFPREYSSPASVYSHRISMGVPDTPSSVQSTAGLAVHSVAVLLPFSGDELPPSYQVAG